MGCGCRAGGNDKARRHVVPSRHIAQVAENHVPKEPEPTPEEKAQEKIKKEHRDAILRALHRP